VGSKVEERQNQAGALAENRCSRADRMLVWGLARVGSQALGWRPVEDSRDPTCSVLEKGMAQTAALGMLVYMCNLPRSGWRGVGRTVPDRRDMDGGSGRMGDGQTVGVRTCVCRYCRNVRASLSCSRIPGYSRVGN